MYDRSKEKKVAIVYPRVKGTPPPWEHAEELSIEQLDNMRKNYRGMVHNMGNHHPNVEEWRYTEYMLEIMSNRLKLEKQKI